MGLLDVLNGMQQGPRGPSTSSAQSRGGMSPLSMAIMALLAYKAVKHLGSGSSASTTAPAPSPTPSSGFGGGGLGGLLGGLLGGGAGASVISGGLGDLLKQFQQSGQGETANSWVGPGPNKAISPNDLANALGSDQINNLMSQSGLSREDLLNGLSRHLPDVVDHLTPDGRLPTESELANRL